jgi:hypothetical protein
MSAFASFTYLGASIEGQDGQPGLLIAANKGTVYLLTESVFALSPDDAIYFGQAIIDAAEHAKGGVK